MTTRARFLILWEPPEGPQEFDGQYREVHVSPEGRETGADVASLARYAAVRGMVYELEDL